MTTLSILIPSWNGRHYLERCLPAVCSHSPSGTQILVIDDASTDGTFPWLHREFPAVDVVTLQVNQGFCAAVNEGLKHARGEIIELLNNDTEVCSGWAEAGLRPFADRTVGSVAPLVVRMEQPEVIDSAGVSFHVCGWAYNRGHGLRIENSYLHSRDVFGASASAGFYRRSALERTGGLRSEFGAYLEDVDLAFRLRWAGYRCVYEPAARVLHRGHGTYGPTSARVTRFLSRNEELLFWMNMPLSRLLLALGPHMGFCLIRLARKLLDGRLPAYLRGKLDALAAWRQILERRCEMRSLPGGNSTSVDLALSEGFGILRQGLTWLRRRQCA